MSGINLVNQRTAAYYLDCKSSIRFYLPIFFLDLMNAACVKGLIIYNMMHQNNQGIGGVDLVNHRAAAYHLDCESLNRFYLPIFLSV